MVWRLRTREDAANIPTGRIAPDYGPQSEKFTVRMHHGGRFYDHGKRIYSGPEMTVDHFDFCDPDELSMLEINTMGGELGLKRVKGYYCSRGGVDKADTVYPLENDSNVMLIVQFITAQRVVGLFVEHVEDCMETRSNSGSQYLGGSLPEVVEGVDFIGEQAGEEVEFGGISVGEEVEFPQFPDPLYHVVDDVDNGDSDYEQSIGSDTDYSEEFVDSEGDVSDDEDFRNNIDCDVEWGGTQKQAPPDEGCSTGVVTRSKAARTDAPEKNKVPQFPVFNKKLDIADPRFEVSMTFPDHMEFKAAVRAHSIKWGREIKFIMNQPEKVQAKCVHQTCKWQIYAAQIKGETTMQIRTYYSEHKCPRLQKTSHANAKWVADTYFERLCLDPKWNVDVMGAILQNEVKLCFTRHQLYRAKKIAASVGGGHYAEQYALLWNYAEEIKMADPDTTVMIKCKLVEEQPIFKRFYICWGPLKKGLLEGCRPFLSLDGCHLKSLCGGILLTAVGIDGNNDPYPVAYAVVEKEKKKSWAWFLKLLKNDLKIVNPYSWTIMSDKQKGLIDVVDEVLGGCEHRFCVMHLYQNFKLSHRGLALKNLLWKAERATRVVDFQKSMDELKMRDAKAHEWLANRPPAHWSKSHFSTFCKSDMLLNNLSESFNSMIVKPRKLPIVDMLETMRHMLMKRVHVRRDLMVKKDVKICPKILKLLDDWKKRAMDFQALWNGKDQFEVELPSGGRWKVNTSERECSCRKWQLTGIPCPHAISSLYYLCVEPEDYVDECYSSEKFVNDYSYVMPTISSIDEWPKLTNMKPLAPPVAQRMPGRPKNHDRKKEKNEEPQVKKKFQKMSRKGMKMTCSICHQENHNSRGCPLNKGDKVGMDIPAADEERTKKSNKKGATRGQGTEAGCSNPTAQQGKRSKAKSKNDETIQTTAKRGRKRKDGCVGAEHPPIESRPNVKKCTPTKRPTGKCATSKTRSLPTSPGVSTRSTIRNSPNVTSDKGTAKPPNAKKKLQVSKKKGESSTQASTNIVASKDKGKKLVSPEHMANVKFSTSKGRSPNVITPAPTTKQVQFEIVRSYWVALPKV